MTGSRVVAAISCCLAGAACSVRAQSDDGYEPARTPVVFFPPGTPIYGAVIEAQHPTAARIVNGRRLVAPGGMADFAGENFYPALSTRLFLLDLKPALESRLQAYRAQRWHEVNALLNQFVILYNATEEEREQHLQDFAREQSPRLLALEREAEQLNEALIADGLRNRIDWNAGRRWRLGAIKAGENGANAEAEFQIVRAAAHYEKGLLPQQRGLLREVAMELRPVARKARGIPAARNESDAMFFSPETTRFRLPPDLPASLREKIGVYNGRKATLKRELRELVVAQEGVRGGERRKAFDTLADTQWTEIVSLEELAEEIRHALAPHWKVAPPPAPPWIPSAVMTAIQAYNEDRDTYFGQLRQEMDHAASLVSWPDSAGSAEERARRQREFVGAQTDARRRAVLEFQKQNDERFKELELRYKAIREMLSVVAEKQIDRKTGRALDADTLLRQYGASMEEFNTFGRESAIYTNYRIAMLQPGLSPEQRRLLLSYALVGLAQPLPHGEPFPRTNSARPNPSS